MSQPCILYVDDNENDWVLLQIAFSEAEITIPLLGVEDGQKAVEYLSGSGLFSDRSKHPLPVLVLMDLNLPKLNGLQLLRWIRSQPGLKTLVVIVVTSSPDAQKAQAAYELGANAFAIKPFGNKTHLDFARGLKSWWLDVNQFAHPEP